MYSKILIANRGEIAVRIIRACKEMGISTVAVYSQADAEALHVALADESYCIGKADASDSYLDQNKIISAAMVSGAQAIHPGYGFLSENPEFSQLCANNNIAFIGATVESMKILGDKEKSKSIMEKAGLDVIPGSNVLTSVEEAFAGAIRIGYPVMLKARSGGGGRGIRLIKEESELEGAYMSAVAEAIAAFGDGGVYLEKYIHPASHIELQILADEAGNVVCLGDRDCSIQIKNQKIIEESPSPSVNIAERSNVIQKAIAAVRKTGYVGVGTLEFLKDKSGHFYFMEMNIRLQVEHTVTEALTGIDLVKWQIRTSAGISINFNQENVALRGSAIECRINASAPGKVSFMHVPGGPFVRFDTYLLLDTDVTPYYDPLIGKIIIYAGTREEAVRKMKAALCELIIDGVPNNIENQIEIISSDKFMSGKYDLDFFVR